MDRPDSVCPNCGSHELDTPDSPDQLMVDGQYGLTWYHYCMDCNEGYSVYYILTKTEQAQ